VLVSYVVRLVPEELSHGRFVGEVEDVATGVQRRIRDVQELVRFCQETALPTQPSRGLDSSA
jgi:hypothetical protein